MTLKEYKPGTAFNGVVGRTFDTSSASLARAQARAGGGAKRPVYCPG